jgi:hypothetical protein
VAIPEQIRKQSEAVQELYKTINPEDDGAPTPPTPVGMSDGSDDNADAGKPAESAAPSPAGEQKPGDDKAASEETLVQKYKTLQGMYNADVPRLHQQTREQAARLQQLEQLIASMSSAQSKPQEPAAAPKLVSAAEVEEYGDSLEVMRKVSREELNPILQRLSSIEGFLQQIQSNVVPQVQQVVQRQAVSAEQLFWSDLSGAVSNWREVNDNPEFQAWLLQPDPLTNITRQTYLEDAQRALDAPRVANFFRTWLEKAGHSPVAQNSGRAAASSELERQVSPGKSKNTGTPAASKGRSYKPEDITTFFNEVRQGLYKGRDDERNRIEADIFAAQREGRILQNA